MFAKNFCQRSHYSVLNMTLYDIPKVKIHSPMTPLECFTSRVTVSFFLGKWQALFSCPTWYCQNCMHDGGIGILESTNLCLLNHWYRKNSGVQAKLCTTLLAIAWLISLSTCSNAYDTNSLIYGHIPMLYWPLQPLKSLYMVTGPQKEHKILL